MSPGAPVVREARAVDWPDTGLGCPEKGKAYAQVVTPGFRVLLQLNAKVYRVHVGARTSGRLRKAHGKTARAKAAGTGSKT